MSRKIEDAFNDCFERLLSGESLDSCLSSYPEYIDELDSMLRATFDIKRKAYPIQPRPEFKYWARVRMQGIQQTAVPKANSAKVSSFNIRRNLAISLAALLVFVMASTGTVAASSEAMPDQPLYDVKLAVEQVQLTFTTSDIAKAELHANLAEKRAHEIAVMAKKGNTEKVISTETKMYYQLDQAEQLLASINSSISESREDAESLPTGTLIIKPSTPEDTADTTEPKSSSTESDKNIQEQQTEPATGSSRQTVRLVSAANKAKASINASTTKTITILQDALDNAPNSVKPKLTTIIERTKTTNARIIEQTRDPSGNTKHERIILDNTSTGTDKNENTKPKIIHPFPKNMKMVPSDNGSKTDETNDARTMEIYNKDASSSNNNANNENLSNSITNLSGQSGNTENTTRTTKTDTLQSITTTPSGTDINSTNRDDITSPTKDVTEKTVMQTDMLR